jgi:hypothetical protein
MEKSKTSEIVGGSVARKTGFVEGMSAGWRVYHYLL